jgi:dihydroxyacetone kinase
MTRISGDPASFAEDSIHGFCDAYAELVRPIRGGVLRATATPRGKVAVVVGGGGGHYPAFAGYVGQGFADAAVCGDIFASPSTRYVFEVARAADRGAGVILAFGNYAGDVLNFGVAAERLRGAGIDTRILATTDDVASAGAHEASRRRGIAGDLPVFKIASAAAEAGLSLDEVDRVGQLANARTRSFGVAFSGCTLPGSIEPLFEVPKGQMALGLGLHGEPGIAEQPIVSASELATILTDKLLGERPDGAGDRVAVMLNGLGSTKYEELFVLWGEVSRMLRAAGLHLVAPLVGEYATSLDMAGCSLTFTWLDDELESYWLAPADAPGFRRGHCAAVEAAEPLPAEEPEQTVWPVASEASQADGKRIATALRAIADMLHDAEDELGHIDALAGDGDHGQGMARGSSAAAQAAERAAAANAGAASVLATGANAWADRAGGTSGAIWGLLLLQWSQALSDDAALDRHAVVKGAKAAQDAVTRLGRARVGDKTLVDSLVPFVETLEREVAAGHGLRDAWHAAATASTRAADATKDLTPKMGRARTHETRSLGHPDAGAISLAMCARSVAPLITSTETSHD